MNKRSTIGLFVAIGVVIAITSYYYVSRSDDGDDSPYVEPAKPEKLRKSSKGGPAQ